MAVHLSTWIIASKVTHYFTFTWMRSGLVSSVSSFSQVQKITNNYNSNLSRPLLPTMKRKASEKLSDGAGSFLMSFLLYDDPDYTRPMRTNPNLDKASVLSREVLTPCCNIHFVFFSFDNEESEEKARERVRAKWLLSSSYTRFDTSSINVNET